MESRNLNLTTEITGCKKCPRLRKYCARIAQEKRKAYATENYWGKPVPSFGDPDPSVLIIGLAPAAHGANRTGRMFTGDRSGDWLYRALHKVGFANQPTSVNREDGLKLRGVLVSAAVHCAPPDNKPTPKEISNCSSHLEQEMRALKNVKAYLALGKLSFDQTWNVLKKSGEASGPRPAFAHGVAVQLKSGRWLFGSYHPSQQNTFTGKLTEPMFDSVFTKIAGKR